MRQPHDIVQAGVRLPESLRRKLEREAKRHHVSLNREIRMRLEDSLEKMDAPRALDAIQEDMRIVWERYGNRLMMLRLEEGFVKALTQSTDMAIVAFANSWLIHHEHERQLDQKHKQLIDPNIPAQAQRRMPSPTQTREESDAEMRAVMPKLRSFKKRSKGGAS